MENQNKTVKVYIAPEVVAKKELGEEASLEDLSVAIADAEQNKVELKFGGIFIEENGVWHKY